MNDRNEFLTDFGLVGSDQLSRLDEIILKLEVWMKEMELIKNKLKDKIENSEELDRKDVKLLLEMYKQLNDSIALYGKYTGDLKNQNVNLNINMDYKDALMGFLGLANDVLPPNVKVEFVDEARKRGLTTIRKME